MWRAVRAGTIVRAQRVVAVFGRPLKLISKDFPVVSTADVVLVLSTAGFVEQEGQTA